MRELVTIPISFFEVAINYEEPDIQLLGNRVPLVEAIFAIFSAHGAVLDDIEVLTTGKLSEQGVTFKIPAKNIILFVSATLCRFSRTSVSWDMAKETIGILADSIAAVQLLIKPKMASRHTSMGMHIQPTTLSFKDILRPFIPHQLAKLESDAFKTMATITRWPKRAVTIDGSGSVANGLYVKLEREFESKSTLEEMEIQLRTDEEEVFEILGIEEDQK
jgi:hypothetical protein